MGRRCRRSLTCATMKITGQQPAKLCIPATIALIVNRVNPTANPNSGYK